MSILGLGAGIAGFISDKKKNKRAKKQMKFEKEAQKKQFDLADYIQSLAKQAASMSGNTEDVWGGKTSYDPVTGTYKTTLGEPQQRIQNASDAEDLLRNTHDMGLRRQGLNDFERMRERSSGEADTALRDMGAFKRGVGAVDAGRVASQLYADRTKAVNAGYDDAERAAQTLQLRTGNAAIGDSLGALARDRVRAQSSIGSPELEGLQFAEGINSGRQDKLSNLYNMFGNEARGIADVGFDPSQIGENANARTDALRGFDLSKLDLAMGGSGSAAGVVGNATAGRRAGYQLTENMRVPATANFLTGMDKWVNDTAKAFMPGGGGMTQALFK